MRFIPNPDFAKEMSEAIHRSAFRVIAEEVKRNAEGLARSAGAPWMRRQGHETIEVGEDADSVYVANTDHAGHLMEYGSVNNSPSAPLRRGAQAAGLRVDESQ